MQDTDYTIKPIAHIRSPFSEKFGIPRQSNIVSEVVSTVVFEPEFRNADSLRGIEEFGFLWLIWQFSANLREQWSPTVRPPRLGGNQRVGVFATRSPFRPNALGLSSVRLLDVVWHSPDGPLLSIGGADLLDGTPIFDIKPYLPYTDSHADAASGFAASPANRLLVVDFPQPLLEKIPHQLREQLSQLLANDPRPAYHDDPERVYGMVYESVNVRFKVSDDGVLSVVNIF